MLFFHPGTFNWHATPVPWPAPSRMPPHAQRICAVTVAIQRAPPRRLSVPTVGIADAEAKITFASLAYDIDRLVFHERRATMG